MQPAKTDEYTLWLEPNPREGETLRLLIKRLAARAGTPAFEPHVTLLPGLHGEERALIEKTRALAGTGAVPVFFGGAAAGNTYHKCLYLEGGPSPALTELRGRAEELFGISPEFHPHLSLAYGVSDEALKAACIAELAGTHPGFTAQKVSLWHARGLVEEWRRVAEFPL